MYFDTAVAGYWRALAMPYAATMQSLGGDMFVRKATLEYVGSAVYDDVLDIGLRCARVGNSSMSFVAGAFRLALAGTGARRLVLHTRIQLARRGTPFAGLLYGVTPTDPIP